MLIPKKNLALILSLVAIGLLLPAACLQQAQAADPVKFTVDGLYGVSSAGIIHIKIDTDANGKPDTWMETYCVDYHATIESGHTYQAYITDAPDNPTYRSVAFIQTWWHIPGTYSGNPAYTNSYMIQTQAAAIQRAIWKITDNRNPPSGDATTIANDATGKDIVRATDILTLTSTTQTATSATLKAKVTLANGLTPRANVMVVFKLTGVTSTTGLTTSVNEWNVPSGYTYKGVTNANGEIQFTITYSQNSPLSQVEAYTKGIWPKLLDPIGCAQVLSGVSLSSSLVVKQALFVVPEYELGSLLAVVACFAALLVFKRKNVPHA